ncbi:MAG: ArsR family transcriptional regulator [Desulfurococcaceae archaeon]
MGAETTVSGINTFKKRLALLRHLDSIIDFSRATSQLELILYLYSVKRPVTTDDLATAFGYSKKAVLDSLRKLEKKGLISKEKDGEELRVSLSERGEEFVSKIVDLLKPASQVLGDAQLSVPVRINIAKEIMTSINLYKLVVYLGLVKPSRPILVRGLARLMGMSRTDLDVLLSSFTQPPTKLFRVVKASNEDALLLDKQGFELLRRTLHYKIYVSSLLYKLLVKLTGTPWTSEIMLKLNSVYLGVLTLVLVTVVFIGVSAWMLAVIVLFALAPLVLLNLLIYQKGSA